MKKQTESNQYYLSREVNTRVEEYTVRHYDFISEVCEKNYNEQDGDVLTITTLKDNKGFIVSITKNNVITYYEDLPF